MPVAFDLEAEALAFLVPDFEAELADFFEVKSSAALVTFRTALFTTFDTASGTMLVCVLLVVAILKVINS